VRALGGLVLAIGALLAFAASASATSTLVVDDDKAQCPNAGYTDLDQAVFSAQSHDKIRICPGDYPVDTATAPSTSRCPEDSVGTPNGLRINKSLDLLGAGANLVTIHPTRNLGDGQIRDFKGDVITVCASQPGSTSFQDVTVNISGVTVTDGGFNVDAGVNFYNSHGSVSSSIVGPLGGPGLGWGVAATNGYSVSPAGAFVRTVTLTGDSIFGYGAGGVLSDGAKAATPTTASGVATTVNISASTITGTNDATRASQYGVQVNAGARALVQTSAISNNQASSPQNAVGVLLTNADTAGNSSTTGSPTVSQYFTRIGNNNFAGDGYAIFNADATNTGVRQGAPVQVTTGGTASTGDWYGAGTGPVTPFGTPSAAPVEGISGPDLTPAATVAPSTNFWATSARTIAAAPAAVADANPTVAWGTPSTGDSFIADQPNDLLVLASDDFGVSSVDVTVAGDPQPTMTLVPYEMTYTPPATLIGSTVTLVATVADSAGHTAQASIDVPVEDAPSTTTPPPVTTPTPTPTPPAISAPVTHKKCKKGKHLKHGKCVKKKKKKK
jgi:hypothetical protein